LARLTADAKGDLFGTTHSGGTNGYGTVFELVNTAAVATPVYASTPTTLVSFNGSNGEVPYTGLTDDANGDLFGTTPIDGANGGYGTVFEITDSGFIAPNDLRHGREPASLTLHPFGNVSVTDPNLNQTETITVARVENAGNAVSNAALFGILFDPNAATDGSHNINGVYTVTGSAAAVTTDLQDLLRSPGLENTNYTIHVTDKGQQRSC
jgi:hypothetical protein